MDRIGLREETRAASERAFERSRYRSVQHIIGAPNFGQPLAAFPGRQAEVGIQVRWGRACD